ncbi:dihydrolipoyl dehydrogenase family protein [Sulfuracidifex metallicus]|uniref:FAD-dependent oxidoreductase n=2 Tax=Sulfuracidifex metallicus TaxID=47303 RepID=A0A6A9QG28_SULME|nr:NAD(P)/FAD-dependent oxidoreductase [Sulfuracidifex metallicus]MUN28167.1 FAD-dependent oxidoreductase [Sulfuracidifex metallicus DSM 6482 = JCM 9184]WOE51298.1 NAD(P)/FAD-dependent oxidoreductase [Sulfuracidifex metallicus DSM 6482 = JCM 9184]
MDFDVAVIGGGVGGLAAAVRAAEAGKKVAIVEKDQLGGECINRACIPSKTLIDAVKLLSRTERANWIKKGNDSELSLDYNALNAYKTQIIDRIRLNLQRTLEKYSVTVINGKGEVQHEGEVKVGNKTITTDKMIISTGSVPISIPDFPLNGKNVLDPWSAMNLPYVPPKVIIVGGGVAGVELATLFRAMGKEVTILELMPRLLPVPGLDKDVASTVKSRLEEKGIKIYLQAKSKVTSSDGKVRFHVETPSSTEDVEGDLAVITIGRKAVTDGIDLNSIKVNVDKRGYIITNEKAMTSNPKVYAVGDVTGVPQSATKAWKQGLVAGDNLTGRSSSMPKYMPLSIFADLEIGSVGKSIDDLKAEGVDGKEILVKMEDIPRAWTLNEPHGFFKLIVGKDGKILGAHMVGEGATEVINTISMAMELSSTVNSLYPVTFSHPTVTEVISEAVQRAVAGEMY